MSIVANTVNYLDGETLLEGYCAYDGAIQGQRPVVLIHHAWAGRDEFVANKARKLAELGYLGFATDMYGKGVLGTGPEQNAQLMQPFMADRAKLQHRLQAALATVKLLPWADNQRIAAIGFCFGGLCALDLARTGADIRGVVAFHGLFVPPANLPNPSIKAKVLILHGHDDPLAPPEQAQALQTELTQAGADWQMHLYGNTKHAFTNPLANDPGYGLIYQPIAEQRSWQAMQNFLNEVFV